MERFRLCALASLAVAGCMLAAGCGTPVRAAAATKRAPVRPSATAKPAPAARRTPLPVSGPCTTAELSVTAVAHRKLDGLQIEQFLATDASHAACSLTGSPQLTPYGPLSSTPGAVTSDIATSQEEFDGDDEGAPSPEHLDLQPGDAAAFDVAWYPESPVVCEQATGFGFGAPGDTSWSDMQQVSYQFGPVCDGLFYVSTVRTSVAPPATG
jgi:hypothetical protein